MPDFELPHFERTDYGKDGKRAISLYTTRALYLRLHRCAEASGCSMSKLALLMIEHCLDAQESPHPAYIEQLEADAAEFERKRAKA